jgi:hypothetical protein
MKVSPSTRRVSCALDDRAIAPMFLHALNSKPCTRRGPCSRRTCDCCEKSALRLVTSDIPDDDEGLWSGEASSDGDFGDLNASLNHLFPVVSRDAHLVNYAPKASFTPWFPDLSSTLPRVTEFSHSDQVLNAAWVRVEGPTDATALAYRIDNHSGGFRNPLLDGIWFDHILISLSMWRRSSLYIRAQRG